MIFKPGLPSNLRGGATADRTVQRARSLLLVQPIAHLTSYDGVRKIHLTTLKFRSQPVGSCNGWEE